MVILQPDWIITYLKTSWCLGNIFCGMKWNFTVSSFRRNFLNQMPSLLISINCNFQGLDFSQCTNNSFKVLKLKLNPSSLTCSLFDPGQLFQLFSIPIYPSLKWNLKILFCNVVSFLFVSWLIHWLDIFSSRKKGKKRKSQKETKLNLRIYIMSSREYQYHTFRKCLLILCLGGKDWKADSLILLLKLFFFLVGILDSVVQIVNPT